MTNWLTIASVWAPGLGASAWWVGSPWLAAPVILLGLLVLLRTEKVRVIAVFLVVGRQDNQWPENLFSLRPLIESGQTITSKLGGSETNIAYGDPLHWGAMVGLGVLLLAIVMIFTLAGFKLQHRKHAP